MSKYTTAFLCHFLTIGVASAENIDPNDEGLHYAWGENIGWLNFEPQGDGSSGVHVYDEYLDGYIWSENVGWISMNCLNDDYCDQVDHGVINDGQGVLTGFAWSENAGWISFSCQNTTACGTAQWGVTIDTSTGRFHGSAWGENVGWINFSDITGVGYGVETSWRPAPPQVDQPQQDKDDDKFCFLATIASGSYLQSQLNGVRQFRDRYLKSNAVGRWLTSQYYKLSPKAITLVNKNPKLATLSRWLVTPFVYLVSHLNAFLVALFSGVALFIRNRRKKRLSKRKRIH